ncbi:hypothetical protein G6F57_001866 [Rhizopus arrhizus]|uniref:Thioesterase-like superfamily-domain-containing protein n=1 Tax=Rhizopus oryzae TaxID=64495 RepID=A0A9P6XHS6_RHIOR|nr:hypothetical protein G6F23_002591 [Rhizopus arrhizus]KAG1425133.1 hypothetical protein G6F58_002061 [Rhizopus delemar]KAG0768861.1 hypothetical protein G6F24_001561 [Rhizopus arrhizus]KAG0795633.1 hypothetical protein G6F21_001960 [Rhizopus arrhizus]KAG0802262.1 hypothetical protein G6F22_000432 [Rhizopus arrhizus]
MSSLSVTTQEISAFDKVTHTAYLGQANDKSHIFAGAIDRAWCIGEAPNGGYVASILLGSVMDHFSQKHQKDPIAMNCFYFKKSAIGHFIVEVTEIKMSKKGYCVVRASLKQKKDVKLPLKDVKDYEASEWTEQVQSIITMGNMDSETGLTLFTDNPKPFSEEHLVPSKLDFMAEYLTVHLDPRYIGTKDKAGKAVVNQRIGFSDGRLVDFKSIPYWCDMFIPPPIMLGEKVHGGPVWSATMQLEVQFKAKIKNDIKEVLTYFVAPHIINNRCDIDGQLWDRNGNILALTRHQCTIVPWSRNTKTAPKSKL